MTLQVTLGATVLATSSAFTVSTQPTALALSDGQNYLYKVDNYYFGLKVNLVWTSESGSMADLGNCRWQEAWVTNSRLVDPFANPLDGDGPNYDHIIPSATGDTHEVAVNWCSWSAAQWHNMTIGQTWTEQATQTITWSDNIMKTSHAQILTDVMKLTATATSSDHYTMTTELTVPASGYHMTTGPEGPAAQE